MRYGQEDITVESSLEDRHLKFGVKNPAIIFDMLCNRMYATPLQTCVQEYLCNARDAHREAGCADKPIKVVLPTEIEPTLLIQDFGVGISQKRMKKVFVYLGESTKRASDLETGGFGIGAKSGWSYSKSFGIICVYRGIKRTYLAYLGDKGVGNLDLLSSVKTKEPTSTTISLPIKEGDIYKCKRAVDRATALWEVAPVLKPVNGHSFGFDPTSRGLDWSFGPFSHTHSEMIVVSDGIPYPCPELPGVQDEFNLGGDNKLLLYFETGDLDLAVNREGIQSTEKTIASIKGAVGRVVDEVTEITKQKLGGINDFKTFVERTGELYKSHKFLKTFHPWKGLKMKPYSDGSIQYALTLPFTIRSYRYDHKGHLKFSDRTLLQLQGDTHVLYDDKFLARINNRKIKSYMATHGISQVIVLKPKLTERSKSTNTRPTEDMYEPLFKDFEEMDFVPFSVIKNKKIQGKITITIQNSYDRDTRGMTADELADDSFAYVYCCKHRDNPEGIRKTIRKIEAVLRLDGPSMRLIVGNKVNTKKLIECGVANYKDWMDVHFDKVKARIDVKEYQKVFRVYPGINDNIRQAFKRYITKIDDILIDQYLELLEGFTGGHNNSSAMGLFMEMSRVLGKNSRPYAYAKIRSKKKEDQVKDIEDRILNIYPLIEAIDSYRVRHGRAAAQELIFYMNRRHEENGREHNC